MGMIWDQGNYEMYVLTGVNHVSDATSLELIGRNHESYGPGQKILSKVKCLH